MERAGELGKSLKLHKLFRNVLFLSQMLRDSLKLHKLSRKLEFFISFDSGALRLHKGIYDILEISKTFVFILKRGCFLKVLVNTLCFCLNTYIFWNFLTRFYTLIKSYRFFVCGFRTLLVGWYFHFDVCVRIRGILCEIPLITPSQHRPKRSGDCPPPSFGLNAPALICSGQSSASPNIPVWRADLS